MKFKQLLSLAALSLMAAATLTSCEDILGEWSRPTPAAVTPSSEPSESSEPSTTTVVKYLKWNGTALAEAEIPMDETIKVTSSTEAVTWSAGTYLVDEDVSITGKITLTGDVNLIIKDGCTLSVGNQIYNSSYKNLHIYGQSSMNGELDVNHNYHAISGLGSLDIHSCKVTATTSGNNCGGVYDVNSVNVYGGSLSAQSTYNGCGLQFFSDKSLNIYGGEVSAFGKNNNDNSYGICNGSISGTAQVNIYGGKLHAECADKKALGPNVTITKKDGFTGKIEYSSDNTNWSETADASAKYVRAGY